MKLYSYWRSSCAWRVRICLQLKGIDYEYVAVNIAPGVAEQEQDRYRAENPMGQVPLLVTDDGVRLAQSVAILEYLEERYPIPGLLPEEPAQRAAVRELVQIVNSGIQPLQNIKILGEVKDAGGDPQAWGRTVIQRGLDAMEARAKQTAGQYLVGDELSLAELCLVPQLYNARRFELDLKAWSTLTRVEGLCAEREAFVAAHPDQQPDVAKS
ncbi:MAG: maleylacetoacetate isomerase [Polyangiaceae bacterium]|nr:maleylacetoacetate isomerase [Polyangiaceae bacterium]